MNKAIALIFFIFSLSIFSNAGLRSLNFESETSPLDYKVVSRLEDSCLLKNNINDCFEISLDQFIYGSKEIAYKAISKVCETENYTHCSLKASYLWSDRRLEESFKLSRFLCIKGVKSSCELREDILGSMISREMASEEGRTNGVLDKLYNKLLSTYKKSCKQGVKASCSRFKIFKVRLYKYFQRMKNE